MADTDPVPLSQFLGRVRPEVSECPDVVATNYVLDTLIDFCERSRCWRDFTAPLSAVANQAAYTVVPTVTQVQIVEVIEVKMNGLVVLPQTREWLNLNWFAWDTIIASQPEYWIADNRDQIVLVGTPSTAGTNNIVPRAVLKPTRDATTVIEAIYDHYLEEIAAGAKARLMALKGQPWSDLNQATIYAAQYEDGVDKARSLAEKGYNRTRQRVQASFF